MKNHACHLDFHLRSRYATIGQKELGSKVDRQPEGEIARQPKGEVAQQEKFSNQPNQIQIQFVTDQGDLASRKT